jgi:hypothetical protein
MRANDGRRTEKVTNQALLPYSSLLIALTKEWDLLLIESCDNCLVTDPGQHVAIYVSHDFRAFLDNDELSGPFI